MLCFRCGETGADGPFEHGKFRFRCTDERACVARFEKLKLVAGWKGSVDEREGRVIKRIGAVIVEEMGGKVATEFQVRCLQCDRRGSFFVQKWVFERGHPMAVARALETYILEKLDLLKGMGCCHAQPVQSVGEMVAQSVLN